MVFSFFYTGHSSLYWGKICGIFVMMYWSTGVDDVVITVISIYAILLLFISENWDYYRVSSCFPQRLVTVQRERERKCGCVKQSSANIQSISLHYLLFILSWLAELINPGPVPELWWFAASRCPTKEIHSLMSKAIHLYFQLCTPFPGRLLHIPECFVASLCGRGSSSGFFCRKTSTIALPCCGTRPSHLR